MASVKYNNEYTLDHLKIRNFIKKTGLDDSYSSISRVILEIPSKEEYKILFRNRPYEVITIIEDEVNYNYNVIGDPKIYEDKITIELMAKVLNDVNIGLTDTFQFTDENPVTIIKSILDDYSISYDQYTFSLAEQYFIDLGVKFEVAFVNSFMSARLYEFVDEILKRIFCGFIFDVGQEKIIFHNFLKEKDDYDLFLNQIESELIDWNSYKESEYNIFYNGYNIKVYPEQIVRSQVKEFNFEVNFGGDYGTDYFHQSLLDYTTTGIGDTATLRKDTQIGDVFYPSGISGTFTGNSTSFSVGLTDETINKCNLSKSIYETEVFYNDKKVNNNTAIIRQFNVAGAFAMGNEIIRRSWKKTKVLTFNYLNDINVDVGGLMLYQDKYYVCYRKTYQENLSTANYQFLELLQ